MKRILAGFFEAREGSQEKPSEGRSETAATGREQKAPSKFPIAGGRVSHTTSEIAGKLAILKKALEFEEADKSRLGQIGSLQELLLYVHDVVLFRFNRLGEIGLLSAKSAETVDHINHKLENFLTSRSDPASADPHRLEELKAEMEEWRQKYEALRVKHMQTGVITAREIEIEKECNYLKARIRELNTFLRIANKQIEVLTASAEMVQSLRAKNSLLGSKVEHQARLLSSLTTGQPENRELLATIEQLNSENTRMKAQLESQGSLLEQFQAHLPTDSAAGSLLKGLVDENIGLLTQLEQSQDRLETLATNQQSSGVWDDVDRLQDENIELKSRLEANQSMSHVLAAYREQGQEANTLAKMIQAENVRLQHLLAARKEQIKVFSHSPVNRRLVQAITRLKDDNRQLLRINEQKTNHTNQLLQEREQLREKLRQSLKLTKDSGRLRGQLEFTQKLVASYRKDQYQHELLKKKYAEMRNKYEIAHNERALLHKKLNRLSAEYETLVKEYENLFGKG